MEILSVLIQPRHRAHDWPAWLAALLFGIAGFVVFTRHAGFSYFCHTDEPGKARQILTHEWNFHHPQLLLKTTEWAMQLAGTKATRNSARPGRLRLYELR